MPAQIMQEQLLRSHKGLPEAKARQALTENRTQTCQLKEPLLYVT